MSGPVTKPSDVRSPIPGAEVPTAEVSPDISGETLGAAQVAQSGPSEEEKALMRRAYEEAGQPVPPELQSAAPPAGQVPTPEEQALMQRAYAEAGYATEGSEPHPAGISDSLMAAGKQLVTKGLTAGPVWGVLTAARSLLDSYQAGSDGKLPTDKRALMKFGKDSKQQQQILQNLMGPGIETSVQDDEVMWRPKGATDWKPADPSQLNTLHELVADTIDWFPDAVEGGVNTAATAAGMAAGIPGGPGAMAGAAMLSSGIASTATAASREAIAVMLGADLSEHAGRDLAIAGITGTLGGYIGQKLLRSPVQNAVAKIEQRVADTSSMGKATKISHLQQEFHDVWKSLTHGAHPSMGGAGDAVEKANDLFHSKLGAAVGQAFDNAEVVMKGSKLSARELPTMQKMVTTELDQYFRTETVVDPISRRAKLVLKQFREIPPEAKSYIVDMKGIWDDLANQGGYDIPKYKQLLRRIRDLASRESSARGRSEKVWDDYIPLLAKERDGILETLAKGTPFEGLSASAFSDYKTKIDAVKDLIKMSEKSPETFARSIFKDVKTASMARDTLNLTSEGKAAWDGLRATWFDDVIKKVTDNKTGIVDLTQLAKTLSGKQDVVDEVLGHGSLKELERLGTAMSRVTWQGLLMNPDSVNNQAVLRAFGKFAASQGDAGFAAPLLGAIASYDPEVVSLIQKHGILAFAKEAKSVAGKNRMLQLAGALDRMAKASVKNVDGKWDVPLERGVLSKLIYSGTKTVTESPEQSQAKRADAQQYVDAYLQRKEAPVTSQKTSAR